MSEPFVIPSADEAEAAVVGAVIQLPSALGTVRSILAPADFATRDPRDLFEVLCSMADQGQPIDTLTAPEAFALRRGDKRAMLTARDIAESCPVPANATAYAGRVRDAAERRRGIEALNEAMHGLASGAPVAETFELFGRVAQIMVRDGPSGPRDGYRFQRGAWLYAPEAVADTSLWGIAPETVWSPGEGLMLYGPPGAYKTTLAWQLVLGRLGLVNDVLGLPVRTSEGRVLYIAADRPQQFRRAVRRTLRETHTALLDERLVIHDGPPPHDLAAHPTALLEMAQAAAATDVFLDSLKDLAMDLSKDETGARVNRAVQVALAEGIQVVALHHSRKRQQGAAKPKTLDDLYGSAWLAAGFGSVLNLWTEEAGAGVIELSHVKPVAEPVGPLRVAFDHQTGEAAVSDGLDMYAALRSAPRGLDAEQAARAVFGTVTDVTKRKARRHLNRLVDHGTATRRGDGTDAARWYLTATHDGEERP